MAGCEPYAEQKKDVKTKWLGSAKSTHLADIIIQKILEKDVMSAQEWDGEGDGGYFIEGLTTAQTKLGMIRIPEHETILPWTIQEVDILMSHLCGHREERAIPERLARQTTDRISDEEEADIASPKARNDQLKRMMIARAHKRKSQDAGQRCPEGKRPTKRTGMTTMMRETSPIPGPSRLPPGQERLRQHLPADHPKAPLRQRQRTTTRRTDADNQATKPISPSSFIITTCPRRGRQPSQDAGKGARVSSASTTGTTSTSSSAAREEVETRPAQEAGLPDSFLQTARELQKRLSLWRELNFCGGSFSIASVMVSRGRISIDLHDTQT